MDAFLTIYGLAIVALYIGAFVLVVRTIMALLYVVCFWAPREVYRWHHQRGEVYRWYQKRIARAS